MTASEPIDDQPAMFSGIGAVVVAGGHVEWQLRRLLLWVRGKGPEDLPEVTKYLWSDLAKMVRAEAASHASSPGILAELDQADQQRLMRRRNNVVHAFWWTVPGPGIRANRHERDGSGWILVGHPSDLVQLANELFAFAQNLELISSPDERWPVALPMS